MSGPPSEVVAIRPASTSDDGTTISHGATASSLGSEMDPGDNAVTLQTAAVSDTVIQNLAVSRSGDREDVRLDWEDAAAACGYRVTRSTVPDTGFADASGSLAQNSYTDSGAGSSAQSYFYLIRID